MQTEKKFYVIDAEGHASFSAKKDEPESFKTKAAAGKRAAELAALEPGKPVYLCRAIEIVSCEISSPKATAVRS